MSLKARYRPTERIEVEVEAATQKDLFLLLAQSSEVFGEGSCGNCDSDDLAFRVRNTTAKRGRNSGKSFTYYEAVCRDCGHYLPFGQHNNDQGTLFPNRKVVNEKTGEAVYDSKKHGWRPPVKFDEESED